MKYLIQPKIQTFSKGVHKKFKQGKREARNTNLMYCMKPISILDLFLFFIFSTGEENLDLQVLARVIFHSSKILPIKKVPLYSWVGQSIGHLLINPKEGKHSHFRIDDKSRLREIHLPEQKILKGPNSLKTP